MFNNQPEDSKHEQKDNEYHTPNLEANEEKPKFSKLKLLEISNIDKSLEQICDINKQ